MRSFTTCFVLALGVASSSCTKKDPVDLPDTPEAVYRCLLLANLTGDWAAIEPLIIPHPDAAILWSGGAYPKEVAALLAKQYHSMEIHRLSETPDKVLLKSTAEPIPTEVRKVDGVWRVDVSPVIDFRKRAKAKP